MGIHGSSLKAAVSRLQSRAGPPRLPPPGFVFRALGRAVHERRLKGPGTAAGRERMAADVMADDLVDYSPGAEHGDLPRDSRGPAAEAPDIEMGEDSDG